MDGWLKISEWEWRHESLPLALLHDCDGWAVVRRGKDQLTWPARYENIEEAADAAEAINPVVLA